jgi:hypothetical protein
MSSNIRLRPDQEIELTRRGRSFNFSKFVRDKLDEEFETSETLIQKEEELKKQIEEINKRNQKVKERESKEKISNGDENKYLKQMKEHSALYGIEEARANYNKKFNKNISTEEFRRMIK